MRHSTRTTFVCCVLSLVLPLSACTGSGKSKPSTETRTGVTKSAVESLGAAGCHPASPIVPGPEVRGTGRGATLYGLIETTSTLPIGSAEPVKIVWRMTGSGPLHLSAINPQGRAEPLRWGPELHGSSSYDRPGDEWGAGYIFSSAGCWRLHAQRTHGSADVWLKVRST